MVYDTIIELQLYLQSMQSKLVEQVECIGPSKIIQGIIQELPVNDKMRSDLQFHTVKITSKIINEIKKIIKNINHTYCQHAQSINNSKFVHIFIFMIFCVLLVALLDYSLTYNIFCKG